MTLITQERESLDFAAGRPAALPLARKQFIAATIGLAAVLWFLFLSGWLGVIPGSVMTMRHNVLFNSDTNLWIDRMIGDAVSPEQRIHPLEIPLWRPSCRALFHLLGVFLPSEYAGVFAARLLVATIAGIGVGFLAFLALHNGMKIAQCVMLFIMYLLFTSSSTIALPEHFGISNGLLSIAFVVPLFISSIEMKGIFLGVMVVFCGGTTITNAFFPLGSLVHYSFKSLRAKIAVVAAAFPVTAGVCYFLYVRSYTFHWFVGQYLNFRLLRDPLRAAVYTIYVLVCPAIGPTPRVLRVPGWDMVSYEPALEPLHLNYYIGLQAMGAIAWVILLLLCTYKGFREERTRPYAWLLLGWVLANAVLHNIWGDELFLDAPHWSWALMGLVVLGARDLSRTFVATIVAPILISQTYTLLAIKSALQTITR